MTAGAWARALVAAAALGACAPEAPAPLGAFAGRVADWTAEISADEPEAAIAAGLAEGAFAVTDRSALALEARRTAALRRLAELRALSASARAEADAFTYDVLAQRFAAAAAGAVYAYGDFSVTGLRPYAVDPRAGAFVTAPRRLIGAHPLESFEDAEQYVARIADVAAAIDAESARARADAAAGAGPPGFVIDATLARLEALAALTPARHDIAEHLARRLEAIAGEDGPRIERAKTLNTRAEAAIARELVPALVRTGAALRAARAEASELPGVARLPEGQAFYRHALAFETGTELSPEQIHRIGLDRMRALAPQLDVALRRIGMTEGPVGARLAQLIADPRAAFGDDNDGRALLMREVQARLERAAEGAPRWFGAAPIAALEARPAPAYDEASAPALFYTPPGAAGRESGVLYVNLSRMGAFNRVELAVRVHGEGAPGRHMRAARFAAEAPLVRLLDVTAAREGWRGYAEELADELGFYEGDAMGRIGYLRARLTSAARAIADTGVHARGWTRERAAAFLADETGMTAANAEAEVLGIAVRPGAACAEEIGRREIMGLREEARTALGPDFDLAAFHELLLTHSAAPPPVLAALVRAWIPRERVRARRG